MVSQCANPQCRAPFLYFRDGKLVVRRYRTQTIAREHVELFWFCGRCANQATLEAVFGSVSNLITGPLVAGLKRTPKIATS